MKITFVKRKRVFALISMSDIAFLLLIFLVVTVTVGEQESVTLPDFAYSKKTGFPKTVSLELTSEGKVILENEPVASLESEGGTEILKTALRSRAAAQTADGDLVVRCAADRNTPYGYVDAVLSALRETGLTRVVLAAELKRTEGGDEP